MARRPLLLLVVACLARCTFDGLDTYDNGNDASSDASDASQDAPGDAGCNCKSSETCVLGQCETCSPTWTITYPTGVSVSGEALDTTSNVLYVSGSRPVGDAGASSLYLALVDACVGKIITSFDAPTFNAQPIPGANEPALMGGKLYLHAGPALGLPGGYVSFDVASRMFDGMLATLPKFSNGQDETWQMTVGANRVWFSGDQAYDQPDAELPVIIQSDGVGGHCTSPLALVGDERSGRAITVSGTDVFHFSTSSQTVIRHFDATQCTQQPCACTPTWTSSQYTVTGNFTGAFSALVLGQKVYFGGAAGVNTSLTDLEGFVSFYDLAASKFAAAPYVYNPSNLQDGFIWLRTDGTYLYASGGHDMINFDFTTAKGVVVVLDTSMTLVATIQTPNMQPTGGIAPIGGGFIVSGSASSGSGPNLTSRCTMSACP